MEDEAVILGTQACYEPAPSLDGRCAIKVEASMQGSLETIASTSSHVMADLSPIKSKAKGH